MEIAAIYSAYDSAVYFSVAIQRNKVFCRAFLFYFLIFVGVFFPLLFNRSQTGPVSVIDEPLSFGINNHYLYLGSAYQGLLLLLTHELLLCGRTGQGLFEIGDNTIYGLIV